jgi:hypothetical protein
MKGTELGSGQDGSFGDLRRHEQQESSRTAADRSLSVGQRAKTTGLSRGVRGKETLGRLRDSIITEGMQQY